jgi:succinoglycan biosynthesis transport protein ExoP
MLRWLYAGLRVEPVRDTSMIKVNFDATNPQLAARVANAVAEAYIATHLQQRREYAEQASEWLRIKLEKAQQAVLDAIDKLQRYRDQVGVVSADGMQSVFAEQLRVLSAQLAEARRARMQNENVYRRAVELKREGELGSMQRILSDPRVTQLTDQEQELERRIRLDSERYRETFPGLDRRQETLDAVREQREKAYTQILDALKGEYEVATANEQRLEKEVRELEARVQALNQKESKGAALEQLVQTNRQSSEAFLRRLADMSTRQDDTVSLVAHIIDRAVPVLTPVKPNKRRIVTLAVLLTLMGGIASAFLLERLDNTLKSREEIEERLGLRVLGELTAVKIKDDKGQGTPAAQLFCKEPSSRFAEDVRSIRAAVALSGLREDQQVLLLTSTTTGEGKTTVAVNLAQALAQLRNVLLVDADLRQPSLAKILGLAPGAPGLVQLITESAKVSECVHPVPGDFHLLSAGSAQLSDPLKLLSSKRFAEVLQRTAVAYDTVILDAPSMESVSDAKILAAQSSGVVFVVKANDTPYPAAQQSVKALREVGTPLIGAVLNQVDGKRASSYGRYGKYGGYGLYHRYARYGYNENA